MTDYFGISSRYIATSFKGLMELETIQGNQSTLASFLLNLNQNLYPALGLCTNTCKKEKKHK